ncbi:MAG: DUF4394 domain-containing protein [Acidimicrobiales bacterium]
MRTTVLRRVAALAVGLSLALGAGASAAPQRHRDPDLEPGRLTAYVTTDQNQLIGFNVRRPDQLLSIRNISGLPAGVSLVGIDFRPKTGDLYGVGSNSVVYRVNPQTAIAIAENVAPGAPPTDVPFTPALIGTKFGIDFNPAPDAVRAVSDARQNLRLSPDAGMVLGVDGDLNPGMPQVVGAAYTNSTFRFTQPAATAVQLYVLDRAQNQVCLQNPPNNGTLAMCRRLDDVRLGRDAGWDIAGANDVGYLANNDRRGRATLYTVDETTGDTSNVGRIGGRRLSGLTVTGLAVNQQS